MYTEIKTFEDACNKLGILAITPDLSSFPDEYKESVYSHYKLMIIAAAINDGWKPDWSNDDQPKYYPWFDMSSSASGSFSCYGSDVWYSVSGVGSRLCFETREKAKYAGEQFKDLYEAYFVIK